MHDFSRRSTIRSLILFAAGSMLPASRLLAEDTAPLGIKGYDPVAYFAIGEPTRGRPEYEYEWDERRYRFLSARHRELFRADPVRYAPQFADFCAMALSMGEIVEADPENWLISDGKLYIFGKAVGPTLFKQNLAANIAKANQNRALLPKQRPH